MSALVLHERPAAQVRRPPRVEPGRGVLGERRRRREQREHGGQHQFIGHNASSLRLRSNAGSKHVVNADRCLQAGEIDFIYIIARKIAISRSCVRPEIDRKSTRLNSSHLVLSYAVFFLKQTKTKTILT